MGDEDLSQLVHFQPHLARVMPVTLVAELHDPLVLSGGLDHLAALPEIVAQRLLDVDVLAGLAGPDRHQRVPVIGRGGGHGVDVLVLQQLADVDVAVDSLATVFGLFHPALQHRPVRVAKRYHAHPGQFAQQPDVEPALASKADRGHANVIVGPQRPCMRRQRQRGATQTTAPKERTTSGFPHDHSPACYRPTP